MTAVQDIKSRLDILDLVSQYVPLQRSGSSYKGPCPFHSERTPSFFVFPNRQSWRCFGACARGGDAFSFIMGIEGVDFTGALKRLAQLTGVNLPSRRITNDATNLYKINQSAGEFFSGFLDSSDGAVAREYLIGRGINQETIRLFNLGYSPNDRYLLKTHLQKQGYNEEFQILAGLLSETNNGGYQGLFRGRIMFPICDTKGRLVGFGGRALDDSNPKYLNSRQSPIFDKSQLLYGFHLAEQDIRENGAVVVEGYIDAIMAHQNDFKNVVASMGTSLTRPQVKLIQSITQNVSLALDPDTAGQEATLRSMESSWQVLQQRVVSRTGVSKIYEKLSRPTLKVVQLPYSQDPDQVISREPNEWRRLTDNARPLMEFLFEALGSRIDVTTAQGKTQIAEILFPLVAEISDPFEQDGQFRNLANLLDVSPKTLEASIGRRRINNRKNYAVNRNSSATPFERLERDPLEEYCLALILQNPNLNQGNSSLRLDHFLRVENREVFNILNEDSLIEPTDPEISQHWTYLANKNLPPADISHREATFFDCVKRLEERRLRIAKEEESLRFSQLDPENFYEHEEEVLRINTEIETLFKSSDS